MVKIILEIPDEYENDFLNGYFADALVAVDFSGMYREDIELINVLSKGLEEAYEVN